ncbi:ribonuclease domain-containing protein [Lysobacter brunescens]|uniref:Ribonuclease domain-containing protein n=1 Tax=Lysobacter brunescens TaxID=262323 RepID=A0ABW2Y8U6_9GAMM
MRRSRSSGKRGISWIAVLALLLLGAATWSFLRTPDATPSADAPGIAASAEMETNPLALPPPMEANTPATPAASPRYPDFLPPEAIDTLQLIARGGPYPYRQDDGVFGNRERRLPQQPRGYYREYTVETPGSPDRGARRIVAGGQPPVEYFYTDDHYRSFRRFTLDGSETTP